MNTFQKTKTKKTQTKILILIIIIFLINFCIGIGINIGYLPKSTYYKNPVYLLQVFSPFL